MSVQRSHFRLYLSITLIVLFMLSLAWKRPVVFSLVSVRDNQAFFSLVLFTLPLLLIASLFHADGKGLSPSFHCILRVSR